MRSVDPGRSSFSGVAGTATKLVKWEGKEGKKKMEVSNIQDNSMNSL